MIENTAERPRAARLRMRLWTMDVRVRSPALLTDRTRLRAILHEGAVAGGVTVIGEEFCVFDNAAVTGVLVLAQSHLSIHTWPELALANVDLLTYGNVRGEHVMNVIADALGAERTRIACVGRPLP